MSFLYFSSVANFSNENTMHYRVASNISYINTHHSVMQELEVIYKIRRFNKCMSVFSLLIIMKPLSAKG